MRELEIAAGAAAAGLAGRPAEAQAQGGHGRCANCGAELAGRFCHACGQSADNHKRSLIHLVWEGLEGLLHLDGRLARTLPDLFFRPGRLAGDYMEGRIARHVPPFRMFLVALLVWVFAAEYAAQGLRTAGETAVAQHRIELSTPKGRAKVVATMRAVADEDRADELKEAAKDRASGLADPDEDKAKVEARYQAAMARVQTAFAARTAKADAVAKGDTSQSGAADLQDPGTKAWFDSQLSDSSGRHDAKESWWLTQIHKAMASPEYYLSVTFTWGHRMAFLLLPIVGLTLTLVYCFRRHFFVYDHLLVAMTFLSFVFLANAPGFLLPGAWAATWFFLVALWTPINLYQTLRGGYGSSRVGSAARALIVWGMSFTAFVVLTVCLMVFSLSQL